MQTNCPQECSKRGDRSSHTSHITHTIYISRCSTSVSAAIEAGALARDTRAVLQFPLHSRFSPPLPLLLHSRLHASSVESHSLSHCAATRVYECGFTLAGGPGDRLRAWGGPGEHCVGTVAAARAAAAAVAAARAARAAAGTAPQKMWTLRSRLPKRSSVQSRAPPIHSQSSRPHTSQSCPGCMLRRAPLPMASSR